MLTPQPSFSVRVVAPLPIPLILKPVASPLESNTHFKEIELILMFISGPMMIDH